jgi:nucleoside 2-deoxyribosyltransferase
MNTEEFKLTESSYRIKDSSWGAYFRDEDPNIGTHALTNHALQYLSGNPKEVLKIVSAIIEARLRGEKRGVAIYRDDPPSSLVPRYHWSVSIDELLRAYPRNASEMLDRALLNMSQLVEKPGDEIQLRGTQLSLLYADDRQQANWMLRQLAQLGFVSRNEDTTTDRLASFTIESGGWQHIADLGKKPPQDRSEVFVAMSFLPEMKPIFEDGIRPAIEADGKMRAVRIDGLHHNNKICDEIIAAIRRSRYVVADFTGHRGGVYYEAGFAHGLGLPVIWTVKDTTDGLHFDTRQYNHIVYTNAEELQKMLRDRIAATIPNP